MEAEALQQEENKDYIEVQKEAETAEEDGEVQEQEEEIEADGDKESSEEGTEGETEPEEVEVEFEGNKYVVPKELKGALMAQADYSRKIQEVSAKAKEYETKEATFAEQVKAVQEDFTDRAEIYAIDKQIEGYKNLPWEALSQQDPMEYLRLDRLFQTLKEARAGKEQEINRKFSERNQKQEQEIARLKEAARSGFSKINGWSPELETNLKGYAKELGFADEQVKQAFEFHPNQVSILAKAFKYDQLQKKASQKQPPEKIPVKPVAKIKGGKSESSPSKFRSDMTHEEYDRWREAQRKKKRG